MPCKYAPRPPGPLTRRQEQIVRRIAQGKLYKEIAYELGLSEGWIKNYAAYIFKKLKLPNRTALAVWYVTRERARQEEKSNAHNAGR